MTKQELIEEINLLFGDVEDNIKSFSEIGEYFHSILADDILNVLEENQMNIKIRKIRSSARLPKHVGGNQKSCWMDLYASRIEVHNHSMGISAIANTTGSSVSYKPGDIVTIGFGVAMQLPEGYEGWVVPRSSTEKNFHLLLTNSHGVIDETYRGDTDEWMGRFIAMDYGTISIGDRPAQFRIHEKMPPIHFTEVETLGNEDRGGYGTSGK